MRGFIDAWVPNLHGKTMIEVLDVNHVPLMIFDLIDHDERTWNKNLVLQHFGGRNW